MKVIGDNERKGMKEMNENLAKLREDSLFYRRNMLLRIPNLRNRTSD